MDDKEYLCRLLLKLLQETSKLYHLTSLEYDEPREVVTATFQTGEIRTIPAWMDSGVLLIKDIINEVSK